MVNQGEPSLVHIIYIYMCVCVFLCVVMEHIPFDFQAHGKTFHSGFPNMVFLFHDVMHSPARPEPNLSSHCILAMKSINPIELVSEVCKMYFFS